MKHIFKLFALFTAVIVSALTLLTACGDSETNIVPQGEPKELITVEKGSATTKTESGTKLGLLEDLTTLSPDGKIKALFWQDESGGLYYSVESGKKEVITPSKLGLRFANSDFSV